MKEQAKEFTDPWTELSVNSSSWDRCSCPRFFKVASGLDKEIGNYDEPWSYNFTNVELMLTVVYLMIHASVDGLATSQVLECSIFLDWILLIRRIILKWMEVW